MRQRGMMWEDARGVQSYMGDECEKEEIRERVQEWRDEQLSLPNTCFSFVAHHDEGRLGFT
jgi:hypothetical protein